MTTTIALVMVLGGALTSAVGAILLGRNINQGKHLAETGWAPGAIGAGMAGVGLVVMLSGMCGLIALIR